ncbi:MAG: tail-specific protease [Flavobacteriales bacterium]|nr:tail-specific protease [Flavobacteriales bacterium]
MKKIVYILSVISLVLVVACSAISAKEKDKAIEPEVFEITNTIVDNIHYNRQELNDDFSKKVFDVFIENIDPNKRFLFQKDIQQLSKSKFKLDDAVKEKDLSFFNSYVSLIEKREKSAEKLVLEILQGNFDFKSKDSIQLDSDKYDFVSSPKELKERWFKYVQSRVINELYFSIKKQEDNDTLPKKSMKELETQAIDKVSGRIKDWFSRLNQLERGDRFSVYMNSILSLYGPHTNYFPPKDKEDFDITMSGKLEGIGATLTVKDGYIKVSKIIAGSASWKQGELKAGDLITAVAQGDSTPVDVVNMRLDKAVRLIRGRKGTEVRLTVKKMDGSSLIIPIVRDVVVIEETYAKSLLLNQKGDTVNYGYIHLGSFYAEFGKRNGRRCSVDVLKQIEALKASNVGGIIIDLRNNGGGSLSDAVDMVGYFIKSGPVVQVDGVGQPAQSYKDRDPDQQFDKPIVVMVNEFSASASEIFAAAIQDYGRGVVVGSNTFGKGTVQRFFPLIEAAQQFRIKTENDDLGAVKQTVAKFFRINGGATQLRGVSPDVKLPGVYEYIDVGEKEYDYALPWSSINPAYFTKHSKDFRLDYLNDETQARLDTSSYFKSVLENAKLIKDSKDQTKLPLGLEAYRDYKNKRKEVSDAAKVKDVFIDDMNVELNKLDLYHAKSDTILQSRLKKFKDETAEDHYIRESLRVLSEMVKM